MSLTVVVALVAVAALAVIGTYNGLIGRRNRVDQAFASIDVMLRKRHDLIPNLVASVERYMVHERELLAELTDLRARAAAGGLTAAQRVAAEDQIGSALGRVIVTVERYPDLKANEGFLRLQASLNEVEEQISAARRAYNGAATDFNSAIQMLPGNLFAGPMGLSARELFTASAAERQNADVRRLFQR